MQLFAASLAVKGQWRSGQSPGKTPPSRG